MDSVWEARSPALEEKWGEELGDLPQVHDMEYIRELLQDSYTLRDSNLAEVAQLPRACYGFPARLSVGGNTNTRFASSCLTTTNRMPCPQPPLETHPRSLTSLG